MLFFFNKFHYPLMFSSINDKEGTSISFANNKGHLVSFEGQEDSFITFSERRSQKIHKYILMFEEGVTIHSLTGRQSRCLKDLGCCSWPFLSSFCTRLALYYLCPSYKLKLLYSTVAIIEVFSEHLPGLFINK